jgi:hypothetical protein
MRQDDLVDVECVSDELYGLPLDEFTSTRAVREKQAKSAGDKEVAAQIHQLAKPNLVAWLANQLVRERADEVRPLLELGEGLREATARLSGEQLRELSRQQRQLVNALVQQAQRLAHTAGHKVSSDTARGLEDTLRAALADPDVADALAAGRLTEGMRNSGLGSSPGHEREVRYVRPRSQPTAAVHPLAARQRTPEQRERAEHEVDRARSAAVEAITARQETHDLLEAADHTVTDTGRRVERARRQLNEALQAQSWAEKEQRRARAALDRADRGVRGAQRHLAEATECLDRFAP